MMENELQSSEMISSRLGLRLATAEQRRILIGLTYSLMDVGNEETTTSANKSTDGDTLSRLPHRRIAAWARELMDDFQSIEDEDQTAQSTKDNGDDLGDSLAVKR